MCVCVGRTLRRIFVLMGEEVTGGWMELRSVTICSSRRILSGLSKQRNMRRAGHVARIEARRNFGGGARRGQNTADSLFTLITQRSHGTKLRTSHIFNGFYGFVSLSVCNLIPATKPFTEFCEYSANEFFTKLGEICVRFVKIELLTFRRRNFLLNFSTPCI